MEHIPVKKSKLAHPIDFDIEKYINEHLKKYAEIFTKKI